MQSIQREKEKNQTEISRTERLRGEYEAAYKTQQDYIKERNRQMSSITKEFSFAGECQFSFKSRVKVFCV